MAFIERWPFYTGGIKTDSTVAKFSSYLCNKFSVKLNYVQNM